MKLSNKILLGFFGFIFLYFTAALAELRLSGAQNLDDNPNSITESADLSRIGYLVIRDMNRSIDVIGSDRSRLEVHSLSGDQLKKLQYEVSGDTLVLSGFESEESYRMVRIYVFVPNNTLTGITATSSAVTVKDLRMESFRISENAARIDMSGGKISKLKLDAENGSYLNLDNTGVDTLSVTIEGSNVYTDAVGFLQGSLKNKARMQVNKNREIQLKKDESSELIIF